ncbi:MAG: DNA cytosine methyltransferase [Silicimonas sp.]|nr:DNA cytosine methyltransferase [Silicimonas sp.]
MTPRAVYNEIDPKAAAWLRELIKLGLIADGDVIEKSITELTPEDLRGYTQVHLFAGIGIWSHSLRRAGWPDDRPVWTFSCPCQPFSPAGKQEGIYDERHLLPKTLELLFACRPPAFFGEQVSSKLVVGPANKGRQREATIEDVIELADQDNPAWLDHLHAEMEEASYALAPFDLPAAGFGAPHPRQRLYFAGYDTRPAVFPAHGPRREWVIESTPGFGDDGWVCDLWMANSHSDGLEEGGAISAPRHDGPFRNGTVDWMGVAQRPGLEGYGGDGDRGHEPGWHQASAVGSGAVAGDAPDGVAAERDPRPYPINGYWRNADWLFSRDGKWRPVEPGLTPLVDGAPKGLVYRGSESGCVDEIPFARAMRLKGYGNGIVAEVAKEFIAIFMESRGITPVFS